MEIKSSITPRAQSPALSSAVSLSTPHSIIRDEEYQKRFELTPRSKYKALLADSDDDDDDDYDDETPVGRGRNMIPITKKLTEIDDKLAHSSDVEGTDTIGLTAYERVRRKLLNGRNGSEKGPEKGPEKEECSETGSPRKTASTEITGSNDNDDEDDGPINAATKRRSGTTKKAFGKAPFLDDSSDDNADEGDESTRPPKPNNHAVSPTRSVHFSEEDDEDTLMAGANDANRSSDDEMTLPSNLMRNSRFQELVERKQRERVERENEEKRKEKEKRERMAAAELDGGSEIDDEEFAEAISKSQQRPQRKVRLSYWPLL